MSPSIPEPVFPAPEPEAARHSERVTGAIRAEIQRAGGRIPFCRFMELALYAPGLGYYSAGARKFGASGDFVTAPEISPLFSRCLARQAAEVLDRTGGGLLEVGAGSGVMAAEVLAELDRLDALPTRYLILERSADLRARQRETIEARAPALLERANWLDDLPAPGFRGLVVANELLDAMPAHRFSVEAGGAISEWGVAWKDGRFAWRTAPASAELLQAVRAIEEALGAPLPAGYVSEWSPPRAAWLREVGRRLGSGVVLLVDYGYPRREYYHPQRHRGTLTCFYRHRTQPDPLILPGLQDISVHVDFSEMAEAGEAAALRLAGFTTQADFLLALGLVDLVAATDPLSPDYPSITAQVKRLTLPTEQGELVKAIAFTRNFDPPLTGFGRRDLRGRL